MSSLPPYSDPPERSAPGAKSKEAPAALAAFLRGVERRGAVLAELQAGDAAAGDAALAAAMQLFREAATRQPLADWPRLFWSLLLNQPPLRQRVPVAIALDATDRLGELGQGPRAALLLRLAAGLGEDEAAAVLGVAQPSYRLALQRALPHHADGSADPQAWQQLREQIHRRIKTLPPERLVRLSRARETALSGSAAPDPGFVARVAMQRRPRWLLPALWTALAACVVALALTFWWPFGSAFDELLGSTGDRRVRVEPLPAPDPPAARYGRDAGLVAHRDFALLADAEGELLARELDFYSWLAAQPAADSATPAAVRKLATAATAASTVLPAIDRSTASATETADAPR
ncbi:MAG TPA: hypothetical protein VGD42_08790 [Lysobacter sp.]